MVTNTAQKELKPVSLKKAFVWAGILVGLDAFILNQGAIALPSISSKGISFVLSCNASVLYLTSVSPTSDNH